ncbi:MAG: FAD-binding oxidoreductase [Mycobacteriales bacterium]
MGERLAGICGEAFVRPAEANDAVAGVPAQVVCLPGQVSEVAEVLRACSRHGWRVVPRGSGSKLDWGAPPRRVDVVLDLSRLNRTLEHGVGDLVVRLQAGARYAEVQRELSAAGQRLALDSPHPQATVGGLVSAGYAGPLRLLYGSPRDLLIGVTVVLADATVARSGGKVVKNVAGYDLGKLYTGAYGSLGVIVETVFRLHPLPAASAYVTATFDSPASLDEAVRELRAAALVPAAVEVASQIPGWNLTVLLEGVPPGVADRAERCAALLGASTSAVPPPGWGELPGPADGVLVKVAAEPAALGQVIAALGEWLGPIDPGYAVAGSVAGVLYAAASQPTDIDAFHRSLAALRTRLADVDGSIVVLRAAQSLRAGLDVWGPVAGLSLMRRVKAQFDPDGVLAPGRFVGGI